MFRRILLPNPSASLLPIWGLFEYNDNGVLSADLVTQNSLLYIYIEVL